MKMDKTLINMKKMFFILGVLLFTTLSCSKETIKEDSHLESNQAPESNLSLTQKVPFDICPPGTKPVLTWEFDTFRFKRPKYDCNRGFWFCSDGHWQLSCVPITYKTEDLSTIDIENETTTVAIDLHQGEDYVDFYFPKELINVSDNSLNDFTIFNVEEALTLIDGVTLKKGNYTSRIEGDEIIISVDVN